MKCLYSEPLIVSFCVHPVLSILFTHPPVLVLETDIYYFIFIYLFLNVEIIGSNVTQHTHKLICLSKFALHSRYRFKYLNIHLELLQAKIKQCIS